MSAQHIGMNTGHLVQQVLRKMDFNPKLAAYKADVRDRLSDHYLEISSEAPWLFLQSSVPFTVYAPVSNDTLATDVTVSYAVSSTEPRRLNASTALFTSAMEGAWFNSGAVGARNFTIGRVFSSTVAYLTEAFSTSAGTTTAWTITWPRQLLPEDCLEPLGWVDEEQGRGRLLSMARKGSELRFFKSTDQGDPEVIVEGDALTLRPPAKAPTLVGTFSGGELTVGNTYEYCYTFYYCGRESAPSPVAEIKPSANNVRLSAMEDTLYAPVVGGSRVATAGKIKRVYRRDKTGEGRFELIAELEDGDTTLTIGGQLINTTLHSDYDHVRVLHPIGVRETVNFHRAPTTDRTLRLRYLRRVRPLQGAADIPEWPERYRPLLVDRVLAEKFAAIGDTAAANVHLALAAERLERMRSRELSRTDTVHRLGRWDQGGSAPDWNAGYGIPSRS